MRVVIVLSFSLLLFGILTPETFAKGPDDVDPDDGIATTTVNIPLNSSTDSGWAIIVDQSFEAKETNSTFYVVVSSLHTNYEFAAQIIIKGEMVDLCYGTSFKVCPVPKEIWEKSQDSNGSRRLGVALKCKGYSQSIESCPVVISSYFMTSGALKLDVWNKRSNQTTNSEILVDVDQNQVEQYLLQLPENLTSLSHIEIEAKNANNTLYDLVVCLVSQNNKTKEINGAPYILGEIASVDSHEKEFWYPGMVIQVNIYGYQDVVLGLRAIGYQNISEIDGEILYGALPVNKLSEAFYFIEVCTKESCLIDPKEDIIFKLRSQSGDPDMVVSSAFEYSDSQFKYQSNQYGDDNIIVTSHERSAVRSNGSNFESYFVKIYQYYGYQACSYSLEVLPYSIDSQSLVSRESLSTTLMVGDFQSFHYEPDQGAKWFYVEGHAYNSKLSVLVKECDADSKKELSCSVTQSDLDKETNSDEGFHNTMSNPYFFIYINSCSVFEVCRYAIGVYGVSTNEASGRIKYSISVSLPETETQLQPGRAYQTQMVTGQYKNLYVDLGNYYNVENISMVEITIYTASGDNSVEIYYEFLNNDRYIEDEEEPLELYRRMQESTSSDSSTPTSSSDQARSSSSDWFSSSSDWSLSSSSDWWSSSSDWSVSSSDEWYSDYFWNTEIYYDSKVPMPTGVRSVQLTKHFERLIVIDVNAKTLTFFSVMVNVFQEGEFPPVRILEGELYSGQIHSASENHTYLASFDFSFEYVWINLNHLLGKFTLSVTLKLDESDNEAPQELNNTMKNGMVYRLDFGRMKSKNKGTMVITVKADEPFSTIDSQFNSSYVISYNIGDNLIQLQSGIPFMGALQGGDILSFYCLVTERETIRSVLYDSNYEGFLKSRAWLDSSKELKPTEKWSNGVEHIFQAVDVALSCYEWSLCYLLVQIQNPMSAEVQFYVEIKKGSQITYMRENQTYFVDFDLDMVTMDETWAYFVWDFASHVLVQADVNTRDIIIASQLINSKSSEIVLEYQGNSQNNFETEFGIDDLSLCKPDCEVIVTIQNTNWKDREANRPETWVSLTLTRTEGVQTIFIDKTELVVVEEGNSRFFSLDASIVDCNLNIIVVPQLGDCSIGVNFAENQPPTPDQADFRSQSLGFDVVSIELKNQESHQFLVGIFSEHRTSACELTAVCTGPDIYHELRGGKPQRLFLKANQSTVFYYQTIDPEIQLVGFNWDTFNSPVQAYFNYVKGDSHITDDIPTANNYKAESHADLDWSLNKSWKVFLKSYGFVENHWFYIMNLIPSEDTLASILVKTNTDPIDIDDGVMMTDFVYISKADKGDKVPCTSYKIDNYVAILKNLGYNIEDLDGLDSYRMTFQQISWQTTAAREMKISESFGLDSASQAKNETHVLTHERLTEMNGLLEYELSKLPSNETEWMMRICLNESSIFSVGAFSPMSPTVLASGEPVSYRLMPRETQTFSIPVLSLNHKGQTMTVYLGYDSEFKYYSKTSKTIVDDTGKYYNVPIIKIYEAKNSTSFETVPDANIQLSYRSFNSTIIKLVYSGNPMRLELSNTSPFDNVYYEVMYFFDEDVHPIEMGVARESIISVLHPDSYSFEVAQDQTKLTIELETCLGVTKAFLENAETQEEIQIPGSRVEAGSHKNIQAILEKGTYLLRIEALRGETISEGKDFAGKRNAQQVALYNLRVEAWGNSSVNAMEALGPINNDFNVSSSWVNRNIKVTWNSIQIKKEKDGETDIGDAYVVYDVVLSKYERQAEIISNCPASAQYILESEDEKTSSNWFRMYQVEQRGLNEAEGDCAMGICTLSIPGNASFIFTFGKVWGIVYDQQTGYQIAKFEYGNFTVDFSLVQGAVFIGFSTWVVICLFVLGIVIFLFLTGKKAVAKIEEVRRDKIELSDLEANASENSQEVSRSTKYTNLVDDPKSEKESKAI